MVRFKLFLAFEVIKIINKNKMKMLQKNNETIVFQNIIQKYIGGRKFLKKMLLQ